MDQDINLFDSFMMRLDQGVFQIWARIDPDCRLKNLTYPNTKLKIWGINNFITEIKAAEPRLTRGDEVEVPSCEGGA
jgi:hypothetical protein